eukprot:4606993-Prymnesium_polylepis.2
MPGVIARKSARVQTQTAVVVLLILKSDCTAVSHGGAAIAYNGSALTAGACGTSALLALADHQERELERERETARLQVEVQTRATLDLSSREVKSCPSCHQGIVHYRGHHCHHIKPGSGVVQVITITFAMYAALAPYAWTPTADADAIGREAHIAILAQETWIRAEVIVGVRTAQIAGLDSHVEIARVALSANLRLQT